MLGPDCSHLFVGREFTTVGGGLGAGNHLTLFSRKDNRRGKIGARQLDRASETAMQVTMDHETLQKNGTLLGTGAVIVMDDTACMVRAALVIARFFRHESCGQCTPCRAGTAKAAHLMDQPRWNLALLADLSLVMRDASICGLGQAAPNPVDCVVKYFPHELN